MTATKKQAIALGIISILTIIAGVAVFVLFKFTFDAGVAFYGAPLINKFWPYGIPVLVAGIVGLIASIVKNDGAIRSYLGIGIICLLTFGVFIGLAGYIFFFTANMDSSTCYSVLSLCVCGLSDTLGSSYAPCDSALIGLSQASCAVMVLAWFLMLGGLITSCCATCRCGNRNSTDPGNPRKDHEMQRHY